MRSKLLLSLFTWFYLNTVFQLEQHFFSSRTYNFKYSFHVSNLIQTLKTDWVESSIQSSIVVYNSCSIDYPVSFFLFSSFFFGLHDTIACSLLGFQSQNSVYGVTRLCPFIIRIMCYVSPSTDGSGPPAFPPPIFPPSSLPSRAVFPRVHISLLLFPHLRPFVVYLPSPPQERRLSPAVHPYD